MKLSNVLLSAMLVAGISSVEAQTVQVKHITSKSSKKQKSRHHKKATQPKNCSPSTPNNSAHNCPGCGRG